jgi:pyrimidine-nucleoside phosphorylase
MYEIINKKKRGGELSTEEIGYAVSGYLSGEIADFQMSALLMAICFASMNARETADLTLAMARSGTQLDMGQLGFCVDKHSTGGVGDKVTLVAAPIAAACGVRVPKMAGRGLGHTGGTIDKLESIPGIKTELERDDFIRIVKLSGLAITAQTEDLVPADKKLYELRSLTGTVDSIPLICASVMSKKIAAGAGGIVLDVKVGSGAFAKNIGDAQKLAEAMVTVGAMSGRRCTAILTNMDKPLGHAVGNSIEVIEAIQTLNGKGPADLVDVSLAVASEMICVAGVAPEKKCFKTAQTALESGRALDAFRRMVELQGGNPAVADDCTLLPWAAFEEEAVADKDGLITAIDCERTGLLALELGAGRKTKGAQIDHSAGIIFLKTVGDRVTKGEPIATLHSNSPDIDLKVAADLFHNIFTIENRVENKIMDNVLNIIKGY